MVRFLTRVGRGAAIGAALWTAQVYARNRASQDVIQARQAEHSSYAFGDREIPWTKPLETAAAVATLGGLWGAGCEATVQLLPTPRVISGAVWGAAVWAGAESWYRTRADRKQRWMLWPPRKNLAFFASLGAVTASLASRHPAG
jgi:hypothetical protein